MKSLIQNLLAFILSRAARLLTPALRGYLARLSSGLADDIPRLGDTWAVQFTNPDRSCKPKGKKIDASLHQFGRFVEGEGHFQGEPGDIFEYRGIIARNVLYGTFRRIDSHVLAGTGTFVLKISADSQQMLGHCTWYDTVIDDVWSSEYIWKRRSGPGRRR